MQRIVNENTPVVIEQCRLGNVEALVGLWMDLMKESSRYDKHYRTSQGAADRLRSEFFSTMRDSSVIHLGVFTQDRELVGFATAYVTRPSSCFVSVPVGMLENMYVKPEYRRNGIGADLTKRILNWFKNRKVSRVMLNVLAGNVEGHAFWTRMGFKPDKYVLSVDIDF